MNSADEQIKWRRDDAEAISREVDYKFFDECAALYWPNENKISYRRSAARPVPAGLRVCSTGRDARSLLAASHG